MGELKLSLDEFNRMTEGNYMRRCAAYQREVIETHKRTRSILGAIVGKDPREIYELPGDYDYLQVRKKEDVKEIARKFGVPEWVS